MDLALEVRKMAESALANGQFIVDVSVSSRPPRKVVVLVDADQGITIDDCAEISRQLSKTLDETGLIDDNFFLEVSTPGIEHPLKLKRQYRKNIGRKLKLKLSDKTIEGKLEEVSDEKIRLTQEVGQGKNKSMQSIDVPFADIDKAFVMVSFK
jgi:ribosome maturation factor RimP